MKRKLQTAIMLGVFAICARTTVLAADTFEMWFDENGNGTASLNGAAALPLAFGVEAEPASGISTLFYVLPAIVGSGDVRIWEDDTKTTLSDLLRFVLDFGTAKMYFFSGNSGPNDTALADHGFPTTISPNDLGGIVEVNGQFTYNANGNIYHGISDPVVDTRSVPDAGPTFALSSVSMLLPLFLRRLRR